MAEAGWVWRGPQVWFVCHMSGRTQWSSALENQDWKPLTALLCSKIGELLQRWAVQHEFESGIGEQENADVAGGVLDSCRINQASRPNIHVEFRGHGIGVQLQRHRMEVMRRCGTQILTTNSDLPETIEWYKTHFGYREVGRLKKLREFGAPDIDYWTTLEVELS